MCGFLLFEGFSAPDTGQPNRIDTIMRRLILECKRRFGSKRKRTRKEKAEHRSRLSRLVTCCRLPFTWCTCCCRRRTQRRRSINNTQADTNDSDSLLASHSVPEDDTDVLLDVAVSVTEDEPTKAGSAASPTTPSTGATSASASSTSHSHSSTPLHPLHDLTDSLTDHLKDSISEALPTVTSLDPTDVNDTVDGETGSATSSSARSPPVVKTIGGKAHWAHMSISLRFTIYNFHIHLHHWVYLLIICLFLFLEQHYWRDHAASYPVYSFASAFCLGGSVQGLKYADWFNVIWRKQKEHTQPTPGVAQRQLSHNHATPTPTPKEQHRATRNDRQDTEADQLIATDDDHQHSNDVNGDASMVAHPDATSNGSILRRTDSIDTDSLFTHLDSTLDSIHYDSDENDPTVGEHEEDDDDDVDEDDDDDDEVDKANPPPALPLVRGQSATEAQYASI